MVKFAQAPYLDSGFTPYGLKIAYIAAWLQTTEVSSFGEPILKLS